MIRCVIGLGNPGAQYAATRHNVGFRVADAVVAAGGARWAWRWWRNYWHADMEDPRPCMCCKPATFMNLSGNAVGAVCNARGFSAGELLVVCDDVNLPLGTMRVRQGGSAGGHNGLKSIAAALRTEEFPRLRIGVGNGGGGNRVEHVLGMFAEAERPVVGEVLACAAEAARWLLAEEWTAAAQRINGWRGAARYEAGTTERCVDNT